MNHVRYVTDSNSFEVSLKQSALLRVSLFFHQDFSIIFILFVCYFFYSYRVFIFGCTEFKVISVYVELFDRRFLFFCQHYVLGRDTL